MPSQEYMDKLQVRQNYRNLWHTDLMHTIQADTGYCCFALWCGPCASYLLRKRALYNDMSRVCACMQTQHKVEMDKRDGMFGDRPMAVPPVQQMSRIDQPIPPSAGYAYPAPPPPQAYGYPPPHQGYPAPNYPPAAYPPPAYPPSGYPPTGYPK